MTLREKPVILPHPALPDADWADCFEITYAGKPLTVFETAELTLVHLPFWARALMRVRDAIVKPLGLKTAQSVTGQRRIGLFPILSESPEEMIVGFDDRHLDFRIVVKVVKVGAWTSIVSLTTLVHRKVFFGKLYLAAITPFHRLIVRAKLNGLVRTPT